MRRYLQVSCSIFHPFLALFLLLVAGCTPHAPYRVPDPVIQTNSVNLASDPEHRDQVASHNVERHPEFTLGFVEFDDQGDFWSRTQVNTLQQVILDEAHRGDSQGVLMVVFIHGWKHNAAVCDENVACFREVLQSLYNLERLRAAESASPARRIVGVYAGWRGLSVTPFGLKELSFWTRKNTAHRVGGGQVLELLTSLEELRDRINATGDGNSKLISIGHSFGAAVTYSAVSNLFLERLTRSNVQAVDDGDRDVLANGFGDLVILVNPAFEASLYSGIHELSLARDDWSPRQPAALFVISSETDTATGKAFPIGRHLSTLFQRTRSPEQKAALTTSLGNYVPYRTHNAQKIPVETARGEHSRLLPDVIELTQGQARGAGDCQCSYIDTQILSDRDIQRYAERLTDYRLATDKRLGERQQYGGVEMRRVNEAIPPYLPFLVVGATDDIVTQHNGIYNQLFIDFMRAFLLEMDTRSESAVSP
jgi:hypothetical protein